MFDYSKRSFIIKELRNKIVTGTWETDQMNVGHV
jgi:hypothetical protein